MLMRQIKWLQRFAKRYAHLADDGEAAIAAYGQEVRARGWRVSG